MDYSNLFIVILIVVTVFIIARELILWYFKINERVNNQQRIIELLEKIAKY